MIPPSRVSEAKIADFTEIENTGAVVNRDKLQEK